METDTKLCRKCGETKPKTEFSKHPGTADKLDNRCKKCVAQVKIDRRNCDPKEYPILPFDMTSDEWQVGKITGGLLAGKGFVTGKAPLGDGKYTTRRFRGPNNEAEALAWVREHSNKLGLTRNMIRKVDESTLEVKLTQEKVMRTDIQFLDLCQKYILVSTRSANKGAEYYASISIGNKLFHYHGYITGFSMVDHINRNPMDNRLCNLRDTTPKANNNNRSENKAKMSGIPCGVQFRSYPDGRDVWIGHIKQDGKKYSKEFSVSKYGSDEAKRMAIEYRKELCKRFDCSNGLTSTQP
jgi:hypothetical protein